MTTLLDDPHALIQPNENVKYIHKTTKLVKEKDGFWHSEDGTIYAFSELQPTNDPRPVCGVGVFSLPENDARNEICKVHDFEYTCPVYQAFHTRQEADEELKKRLSIAGYPISSELFYELCRVFGRYFWENKITNT